MRDHQKRLVQFLCRKGHSFFLQGNAYIKSRDGRLGRYSCPICASTRTEATGREYPAVNESAPLPEVKP